MIVFFFLGRAYKYIEFEQVPTEDDLHTEKKISGIDNVNFKDDHL